MDVPPRRTDRENGPPRLFDDFIRTVLHNLSIRRDSHHNCATVLISQQSGGLAGKITDPANQLTSSVRQPTPGWLQQPSTSMVIRGSKFWSDGAKERQTLRLATPASCRLNSVNGPAREAWVAYQAGRSPDPLLRFVLRPV